MSQHHVFVYGTLRKNESNHSLMEGAVLIAGQAWTNGRLFDTGLGYPVLQESKDDWVHEEIYLVSINSLTGLINWKATGQMDGITYTTGRSRLCFVIPDRQRRLSMLLPKNNEKLLRKRCKDVHSYTIRPTRNPYSPDNCRWATPKEQINNQDINIRIRKIEKPKHKPNGQPYYGEYSATVKKS